MAAVLDAFDADVAARPPTHVGALDRSRLRRVVRAMLPLALDDPTFDVTVTAGPTGVAVRVHHRPAWAGGPARVRIGAEHPPAASTRRLEHPRRESRRPCGLGAGGVAAPRALGPR
jgi:hypothetical protein